jgi:(1->4)-alpha-D-glucan 1-alpha-D-glucosylmutase
VNDTDGSGAAPRIPISTYRIQFNAGFTFRQAEEIVPYLAELGISDLYASPYLQARPGSLHGYDIVDHAVLNPEIGTEQEHAHLSTALRKRGMGQLLDIVPNHMGIGSEANGWWADVLEHGVSSPYAAYFDVDWRPLKPELEGKVLLPILGDQFGRVLERGELRLAYHEGAFRLEYFETRLPVAAASTGAVLRLALEGLDGVRAPEDEERMELESIAVALERLPARRRTDPASLGERRREKAVAQRRLALLYRDSEVVRTALDAAVAAFNGDPDDPRSFDRLDALLGEQSYRLAYWRVAAEEINYRRFFDVNDLAGVRVEVPRVFQDTHRLILRLVREGRVTGLRIDHPDGLFHPRDYLRDLQHEAAGPASASPFYVLVEKILTGDEPLPEDWPVAGTVGYEFLNQVNGLFVHPGGEGAMDALYRDFTGMTTRFADLVYEKKRLILRTALVSELTVLTTMLDRISERNRRSRDFTWGALRDALREVIACFPVYRTYVDAHAGDLAERDRAYVDLAVKRARRRNAGTNGSIFDFVRDTLLLRWPEGLDEEARREHADFVMKLQQLTGPVMAKGVEDTAFYVFNRLISLNEVGGEPDRFGRLPEAFHAAMRERAERWPHALSTSSTHDTKRSEDVRARINVLSEIPGLWAEHVRGWAQANARHRREDEGQPIPDRNDEYLLYQTLVGAWPLRKMDEDGRAELVARLQGYVEKATREAKRHTSWINPNPAYDEGLAAFVADVLDAENTAFLDDFVPFQRIVARVGMINALAQTLVKLTAPGVPDVYQGQETWDLSLVDPDNRRPVDYALRRRMLDSLAARRGEVEGTELARELVEGWEDGRIKLHVVQQALRLRAALPALFGTGGYEPLAAEGARAEHVVAFARVAEGAAAVTVVPRLVATLTRERGFALPAAEDWADTRLALPAALAGRWRNVFTGEEMRIGETGVEMERLLGTFPVALLERVE